MPEVKKMLIFNFNLPLKNGKPSCPWLPFQMTVILRTFLRQNCRQEHRRGGRNYPSGYHVDFLLHWPCQTVPLEQGV
jgi:hypothetical protein